MTETSNLHITAEQYAELLTAEAVAVSNYRSASGRYSKLTCIGTVEECEAAVETPAILLVFEGTEYLGSEVVPTKDLLPPESEG